MGVTINSVPDSISLSKNPILFELGTDNYVSSAGAKSLWRFEFTTDPEDGDTLEIGSDAMSVSSVTFTCKDTPTIPSLHFEPPGVLSTEDWLDTKVIPVLLANPFISLVYDVYRTGSSLVLRGLDYGDEYDVDTLTATGFTINISLTQNGVDLTLEDPYKVRVRIHMNENFNSLQFTHRSAWFYFTPNEDGDLTLDLSKQITELIDEVDLPIHSLAVMSQSTKTVRKFFIEAAEHYGSAPWDESSTISDKFTAIKGGYSTYDQQESFYSDFVTGKKFLTNRGDNIRVSAYTKDFLHLVFNHVRQSSEDVLVKVTVYYKDGTDHTATLFTDSSMEIGDVWTFPVGFAQNSMGSFQPSKEAYKYKIWLEGAIVPLEAIGPIIFWIEEASTIPAGATYNEHHLACAIQYFNSFGYLETVQCEGAKRLSTEASRESMLIDLPDEPGPEDLESHSYAISMQDVLEVSSGPLTKQNAFAIREALLSEVVYFAPNTYINGTERFAANIEPESVIMLEHGRDNQQSYSLKFTLRFNAQIANSGHNAIWV